MSKLCFVRIPKPANVNYWLNRPIYLDHNRGRWGPIGVVLEAWHYPDHVMLRVFIEEHKGKIVFTVDKRELFESARRYVSQ